MVPEGDHPVNDVRDAAVPATTAEQATPPLRLEFAGEWRDVPADRAFVIGRVGDLEIDDNPYLHRHFLELRFRDGLWWLRPWLDLVAPSFVDPREQAVYESARALAENRLIPQDLYDRAVDVLGHESITDMIVLMAYYTAVSLTMNFYAVPPGSPGLKR